MSEQDPHKEDEQHEKFAQGLLKSKEAVRAIALWLIEKGYPVVMHPTFVAPNFKERGDYTDSGDLNLLRKIEVKHRPKDPFTELSYFSSRGWTTAFVDSAPGFDAKRPKPYAYYLVNQPLTHALEVVVKDTQRYWQKVKVNDSVKEGPRLIYQCPIERMRIVPIGI